MEKLYEEKWYQKGQESAILGKTTRWYRYQNRVVPIPLNITHLVPVPTYRMCLVSIPNIVVPVPQLPKAQIFVISHSKAQIRTPIVWEP